jgi:DNA polymerase
MSDVLHLDFETFSTADLKKVGTENYVRAPGFAVTVIGWAFGDLPVVTMTWPRCHTLPGQVRDHIAAGGTVRAWNAAFERTILRLHYGIDVPPEQMDCVMIRSAAWGLPAALQTAGDVLGMPIVKDKAAKALMLEMGKPKKDGTFWHVNDRQRLLDLAAYCRRDVEAERVLDHVIPALPDFERDLSVLDAKINDGGVLVDLAAVHALAGAVKHELSLLNAEAARLTGGAVTSPGTGGKALPAWLASQGWGSVTDLKKETIAELLGRTSGHVPTGAVRRVLEIRQQAAKASTAKLSAMLAQRSAHDGRARQQLQFYGAGRTGRWAGRGIQVQNMPKARKEDGWFDVDAVVAAARAAPDAIGLAYANPMRAASLALRGCLVARPGHVLVSIDFAQIEARVVAWLAGQANVLAAFARGEDVYVMQAAAVGSNNRQLGKVLVLACGFQMGASKFRDTAEKDYGVVMTLEEATRALGVWRSHNRRIQECWWKTGGAAIMALGERPSRGWSHDQQLGEVGGLVRVGPMYFKKVGDCLGIRKPNGVKLWYQGAQVIKGGPYGERVVSWGVHPVRKKWELVDTYGGKLVENVTQSTARDIMGEAILAAEAEGLRPIMTVHDEIIWEVPASAAEQARDLLMTICTRVPPWAAGLPIAAEAKIGRRYGK